MNVLELPAFQATPIFTTRARAHDARKRAAAWAPIFDRLPREPAVMRLVDLDCADGAFAAFSGVRFPYAWLDCFSVDDDEETRVLAALNAPVGTRFHVGMPKELPACDALHVGPRAKIDGAEVKLTADVDKLKIVIVDWSDGARLEAYTGFLHAIGLEPEACGMYEPARGWVMYVRRSPPRAPIRVDMTRRPE